MVDQANEWLPLITPGTAVDGVQETDRSKKVERETEKEKERFSSVWLLPALSITAKDQFWQRWLSLSCFHVVSCTECLSAVFNQAVNPTFNSQNKHTHYIVDYSKTLPEQTKGHCENPLWSNGAIKISHIANTHSTVLCWPRGWQPNYTDRWLWKEEATGSAEDW